jgi:arylsulfatase A-like enzyme
VSARGAWLALALGLAAGCRGAEPPRLAVVHRLVELGVAARVEPAELIVRDAATFPTQTSAAARLPRATVDDDTRHVLASFERGSLAYLAPAHAEAGGRLRASLPVGDAFRGARELIVVTHVRARGQEAWQAPPAVLAPVSDGAVRLDVAAGLAGAAELNALAVRAPGATTRFETPPLALPPAARLELALGVLPAAAAEGPVRFTLEACEGERCTSLLDEALDPAAPGGHAWQDRSVDLAAFAGRSPTLRFRTEHLPGGGAFSLPVWADPVVLAPPAAPDARPSFVVLSIDTLRRDHLDVYGYARETAPFLAGLAAEGAVFEGLVAEAATTDPSHMTMFTSLPAPVHGVTRNLEGLGVPATTLAEVLRAHGYRTAAITEDGPLAHDRGFAIGFEAYRENKSPSVILPAGRVEDTFRQARDWLDRSGDRPFFLFLHTFQVHAPYAPPEAYRALFTDDAPAGLGPEQRRTVADYDREIRYVDDQLAALVRHADAGGRGRDTIWVVLSDHGEEFWEHGSLGHGTLPYEEVLAVPLIVRGPGVARGARRAGALHHLDLMPTLLELAGAPAPPEAQGTSFAALLREGAEPPAPPARALVSAAWMLPPPLEPPAVAVRLGTDKLIRWKTPLGWEERRFDLAADPREQRAAPGSRSALAAALARHAEGARALRAALSTQAGGLEAAPPVRLDPEREQTLRALGYIE